MTNPRVFIDTSAFVSLFVKNETRHASAKNTWETLRSKNYKLYTSEYILDELITFLSVKTSHKIACSAGDAILKSKITEMVYIDDSDFHNIFGMYKKFKDKEYSFTDVASFYLMQKLAINEAFTYDHHFKQAGHMTIPSHF